MSNSNSITIIQLTRFGDILQTIWAVRGIKESNPGLNLNLIVRKRFGEPLSFLLEEYFTNIIYLDSAQLTAGDKTEGLDAVISEANSWNSNVLVNLSFSDSSAYFTSLVDAKFKLGLVSNELGAISANGSWSEFVQSTVMRGPQNPFSLIDVFRFIIGVKERAPLPPRNVAGNQIVLHPFASQERKAWTPTKWSEILYKTLKKNPDAKVTIVGSKADCENANIIVSNPIITPYAERVTVECGTLSFQELYNLLKKSFLFCGHDSMVGHLASLAGTQSLTLSLGSVRAVETSPYGLNNYILAPKTACYPCFPTDACSDFKCHKDLSYQLVSECIQQLIDTTEISFEEIKNNTSPLHLSTVDIFQTSFSAKGLLQLNNLSSQELSGNELYNVFYKIVWLFLLENAEESSGYPKLNSITQHQLETFIPNLKQLFELAEFGKKYSRFILEEVSKDTPDIEYIKNCGEKVGEIDEMQVLVGKTAPALNPIIDFYNLKKSKMSGNNLVELCSSSHEIYQSIASFCDIMFELVEKTLNEYKISNKTDSMKEAKE